MQVSVRSFFFKSLTRGPASAKKKGWGGLMNIMVLEDDPSVRETLGLVLESSSHHANLVDSGEAALEALKKKWPDVLLLDLTLPGMSGEQVFDKIRSTFGHVPPTVVLSAAQEGESRAAHMEGAWFLAKPYTIDQLEEVIVEASSKRKAS